MRVYVIAALAGFVVGLVLPVAPAIVWACVK